MDTVVCQQDTPMTDLRRSSESVLLKTSKSNDTGLRQHYDSKYNGKASNQYFNNYNSNSNSNSRQKNNKRSYSSSSVKRWKSPPKRGRPLGHEVAGPTPQYDRRRFSSEDVDNTGARAFLTRSDSCIPNGHQRQQQYYHPSAGDIAHASQSSSSNLPNVISGYVQLSVNLVVLFAFIFALLQCYLVVKSDVDMKVEEYSAEIMHEIEICSRNYYENRCEPETRIPAMEAQCNLWTQCMERNPMLVGRAKVSAHTIAEAINGFVEPISYKTMIFIFLVVIAFVCVSNLAMWLTRARPPPPPSPSFSPWLSSNHSLQKYGSSSQVVPY